MNSLLLFCIILCAYAEICLADSGNLQDICPADPASKQNIFINGLPCKNPTTITSSDFKSSNLSRRGDTDNFFRSSTKIISAVDFPGLNTLGLSIARTDFDVDGIILPQMHPRATEIFFVGTGVVIVGFLDTKTQLFQKIFKEGDVFVIPRGLLHFCVNAGNEPATVYSVLNSQNPGLTSVAGAMFDPADPDDPHLMNMLVGKIKSLAASQVNGKASQYLNLSGF